jgi:hypothetical protein
MTSLTVTMRYSFQDIDKIDNLVHPAGTLTQPDQGGKVGMHQIQLKVVSTTLRAIVQKKIIYGNRSQPQKLLEP